MNRLEQPASKIAPGIPWYSTPPCADNRLAAAALLRVVASSSRGHVNPHTKSPSIDAFEQAREPVERALDDGTCDFDGTKAAAGVDWAEGLDCESWETDEDDTCAMRTICGE